MTPNGRLHVYKVPHVYEAFAGPITAGSDGALWFDDGTGRRIDRITTSGKVSSVTIPRFRGQGGGPSAGPIQGPDGNIWFAADWGGTGTIDRIDPKHRIRQWSIGHVTLNALVSGPGQRIWFAGGGSGGQVTGWISARRPNRVHYSALRFTPDEGAFVGPLTVGPDNNFWSLLDKAADRILPTGQQTLFKLPPLASPGPDNIAIAPGPAGDVWLLRAAQDSLGDYDAHIGVISSAGEVSTFPLGDRQGGPSGLTAGPDGNVWIAQYVPSAITRVTPPPGTAPPAAKVHADQLTVDRHRLVLPLRCEGVRGTFCSGSLSLRARGHRLLDHPARFVFAAETRLILRPLLRSHARRSVSGGGTARLTIKTCAPAHGCVVESREVSVRL